MKIWCVPLFFTGWTLHYLWLLWHPWNQRTLCILWRLYIGSSLAWIAAFERPRWTGHAFRIYQLAIDNVKYGQTKLVFKCHPSWFLQNIVAALFFLLDVAYFGTYIIFGTEENMLDLCDFQTRCQYGSITWSHVEQNISNLWQEIWCCSLPIVSLASAYNGRNKPI